MLLKWLVDRLEWSSCRDLLYFLGDLDITTSDIDHDNIDVILYRQNYIQHLPLYKNVIVCSDGLVGEIEFTNDNTLLYFFTSSNPQKDWIRMTAQLSLARTKHDILYINAVLVSQQEIMTIDVSMWCTKLFYEYLLAQYKEKQVLFQTLTLSHHILKYNLRVPRTFGMYKAKCRITGFWTSVTCLVTVKRPHNLPSKLQNRWRELSIEGTDIYGLGTRVSIVGSSKVVADEIQLAKRCLLRGVVYETFQTFTVRSTLEALKEITHNYPGHNIVLLIRSRNFLDDLDNIYKKLQIYSVRLAIDLPFLIEQQIDPLTFLLSWYDKYPKSIAFISYNLSRGNLHAITGMMMPENILKIYCVSEITNIPVILV